MPVLAVWGNILDDLQSGHAISFLSGDSPSLPLQTKRPGLFLQTSVESFFDKTLEQETTVAPKFVQDGNR